MRSATVSLLVVGLSFYTLPVINMKINIPDQTEDEKVRCC